ncbi:MAG: Ger(x)C family spore germination protein [Clostridia bacterium]|nr:Ger(x)C family spore germination protein [Clostridia bacterium]
MPNLLLKNNNLKPKILLIFLLLICIPMISSCWNYRDIENIAIATGVAVDKDTQTDNYILTIELVNQQSSEKEASTTAVLVKSQGLTIFDAMRNAISQTGKRIFWGHTKVMVISEDIAREGIVPVLDIIWRDTETRPDMWVLVSRAETAEEIFKTSNELNAINSYYLNDILKSNKPISKSIADEFVDFLAKLNVKTNSVVLPVVYTKNYEDKKIAEILGSAVFKEDKLAYFLDGEESQIALLIRDELKGGVFNIEENKFGENTKIALEICSSKVKLTPIIKNNKPVMQIEADIDVGISELQSSVNFIDKDKREILIKDMESILVKKIAALIKKTQKNQATDIFDFNGTIKRKMPGYWKTIEKNWDEVYKDMQFTTKIDLNLKLSSSSQKPIKIVE